jgi:hypothetical protein
MTNACRKDVMTEKTTTKLPAKEAAENERPSFSRARTLDHEVKRLSEPAAVRRLHKRQQTLNEELHERQTRAAERSSRWGLWALLVALSALAVSAWPYARALLE